MARVLGGHQERLRQLRVTSPEVYLAVSLAGKQPTGLGSGSYGRRSRPAPRRGRGQDRGGLPDPGRAMSELATREQRTYERVNGVLHARRRNWSFSGCCGASSAADLWARLDAHWAPDTLIVSAPGGDVGLPAAGVVLRRCARARSASAAAPDHRRDEQGRSYQALLAVGALL